MGQGVSKSSKKHDPHCSSSNGFTHFLIGIAYVHELYTTINNYLPMKNFDSFILKEKKI